MDPVTIALRQEGLNDVKAALRDVQEAIAQLDQFSVRSAKDASHARVRGLKAEAAERQRLLGDSSQKVSRRTSRKQESRDAFRRALGGDSGWSVRRSTSGPTISESSGGASSMMSLVGKAGVAGAAIGVFMTAIDFASDALKQFGGFLISDVIKPQFALEKFATQLENSSNGAVKAQTVIDRSRAIQARWNIDSMEAAQAAATLADKTGDMNVAFGALEDIAMLSKGYGVGTDELSALSAAIFNLDQKMGKEGLQKALYTQLAQGQVAGGRFTIKDIAGLGGELVKNASRLTGDADVRLASIGAALQTGGITGKADVSMTNVNSFLAEAATKLKGSKAVNDKGQIADLGLAIREVLMKTGGDAGKLKTLGYSDTSTSFIMQYMTDFQEALKGGAKSADAAARATSTFEQMRTAIADEKSVRAAANNVMQTAAERYETAMNQIKDKLYSLMPQISTLVSSLAGKGPQLANAAMVLAQVFIAAATALEKLIPETDTRTKRMLAKAQKHAALTDQINQNQKDSDDLDKQIAAVPIMSSTYDQDVAALRAKRDAKQQHIKDLTAQSEALDKSEAVPTVDDLKGMLSGSQDAFSSLAWGLAMGTLSNHGKLGSDPRKTLALSKGDDNAVDMLLSGIAASPGTMDFSSRAYKGFSADQKEALERYRDSLLDKQEQTVAGGAKTGVADAFAKVADKLESAADKLDKAATRTGDVNRDTPIGQR